MKDCPPFLGEEGQKEWASIAEFCTTKWMGTLISHRTHRFHKLSEQVISSIEDISKLAAHIPSSWLDILKENTKRDEDNLVNKKMSKFKRDLDDYNLNRVFLWNKKNIPHKSFSSHNSYPLTLIGIIQYPLVTPLFPS